MRSIPLYDATVPIACTANDGELTRRIEQVEHLRACLVRVERTEHGATLYFPIRPDIEAELRELMVLEKACCPFWGFELTEVDDELRFRWDAPPDLAGYMDQLVASFDGDEPLTAASGLPWQ